MWHLAGNDKGIIKIKDATNEGSHPRCVWEKWKGSKTVSSDITVRRKTPELKE